MSDSDSDKDETKPKKERVYLSSLMEMENRSIFDHQNDWEFIPFDMKVASTIWNYLHDDEELIDVCLRMNEEWIFGGGIRVEWGDVAVIDDHREWEHKQLRLLKEGHIYSLAFGFCPVRFCFDETGKIVQPCIPIWGNYDFVLLKHKFREEVKIRCIRNSDTKVNMSGYGNGQKLAFGSDKTTASFSSIARDVFVYIWERRAPRLRPGELKIRHFNSSIFKLYKKLVKLNVAEENAAMADRIASNPPTFVVSKEVKVPEEIEDDQLYFNNSSMGVDGREGRFVLNKKMMNSMVNFRVSQLYNKTQQTDSYHSINKQKKINEKTLALEEERIPHPWINNQKRLDDGDDIRPYPTQGSIQT
jgi:hypothetical protein